MKKTFLLMALLCLSAIGIFAQGAPNFSGTWTLDKGKSKLGERNRIETRTIKATQTATDLTVETTTKREAPPEGAGGGMGGGNRPGGGGGMRGGFGGDGTTVYKLDGKEVTTETETQMGKMPVKTTATLSGSALDISSARTFNTPNGEMTLTTKEKWTLSDGGKTLTVVSTTTTPRGEQTTEMVYTKN